jgi:AcrR family transcriptional regulator
MPRNKLVSEQMRTEGRAKILAAAGRLFARVGYDRCSVADIAREAGMSQGNVYWYFDSKEKVLVTVLESAFKALDELFQRALGGAKSGRDRLLHVIDEYIALGRGGGGADAAIIIYSLLRGGPGRLTELGFDAPNLVGGWVSALSSILSDAQVDGALPADADPDTLALHFFGYFNGMSITLGDAVGAISEKELRRAVLRLLGVDDHTLGESQ